MRIFILCLVVYFIYGVELRHSSRRNIHDGAEETARLIDFVHKVNNFEQKYPLNDDYDNINGADRDDIDLFVSMKLLQKNYDTARKFNKKNEAVNVQFIQNPGVIEKYINLPEEVTEAYDDISGQGDTQRSYSQELARIDRIEMHRLRSLNIDQNGTETNTSANTSNVIRALDRSDPGDEIVEDKSDDDDRANEESDEKIDSSDYRRSNEAVKPIKNLKEAKKDHFKSIETYNIVKPIIERMITERLKNSSLEKDISSDNDSNDHKKVSIIERQISIEDATTKVAKENIEPNFKTDDIIPDKKHNKLNKSTKKKVSKRKGKKKKIKRSSSSREPGTKEVLPKKQSSGEDSYIKGKRFTNIPKFSQENHYDERKTDNKSEDTKQDSKKQNKKYYKRHKHKKSSSSNEKKRKNSEEINSDIKKADKFDSIVEMEEKRIGWSDYDDRKNSDELNSEANDGFYKRTSNKKTGSKWNNSGEKGKKIGSKRKANDDFDSKFEDGNKDNSWNKKNWKKDDDSDDDDRSTKNEKRNKKDKWNDKDDNKKDNLDIKSDWKSKDDSWNKKKIDDRSKNNDDFDKKTEKRSKMDDDDDWDKKAWNSKEENEKNRKNKSDINDDYTNKKSLKKSSNIKRDNEWDKVGTDNKNSGWGNYDSFKNIKDMPGKVDIDTGGQEKNRAPKVEIRVQKPKSWDRPVIRDNYHDNPKSRGHRSPYRTPIPFVGQKAVYAD